MLLFKHCSTIFADCVIFLITSFEILILLHGLIIKGELYRVKAYNEEADHWIINSKRKEESFRIPSFDSVSSLYKGHEWDLNGVFKPRTAIGIEVSACEFLQVVVLSKFWTNRLYEGKERYQYKFKR